MNFLELSLNRLTIKRRKMLQKVFMGTEYAQNFSCDVVIVGDYNKVLNDATDHYMQEHEVDPDSQLIIQTIRDYNETEDGPPQECSHV